MKVPQVETFEQSLPERQESDHRKGRDRGRSTSDPRSTDEVRISNGARTLHQRKTLTENVIGKVALRTLNRDLDELEAETERENVKPRHASLPHMPSAAAPTTLSGHDTALEILDRIKRTIVTTFHDAHPEPGVEELERLRVDIVQGFEEGLAAARGDLAMSGVLSPELEAAIGELEGVVREGIDVLLATAARKT